MAKFNAQRWARYIRRHRNPLVVAGEGCTGLSLNGKGLIEYALEVAEKLNCPVAATGNVLPAVKASSRRVKTKKIWLAELFRYLEGEWREPLVEKRPDLLLLVGYPPWQVQGLVEGAGAIHVAHLGPGKLACAHLSMEEIPLVEWKRALDDLVDAL
jgi:CO dehydrogenase/acetyl-CoA synthase epsilon subunit